MKTSVETITPDKARQLLTENHGNRVIRDAHVQFLAREMREGRWSLTHQGICIADTGRLLDGQHRLHAIVFSGVTVKMQVTREAEESTYRYMDIAATRTNADRIKLLNDKAANMAACRIVRAYLIAAVTKSGKPSIDDIETAFLEMADAVKVVAELSASRPINAMMRAPVLAAITTYMHVDRFKAAYFIDGYLSGVNLTERHPALLLRNALLQGRIDSHNQVENYWKAVTAVKAHREGRSLSSLIESTEDLVGNRLIRLERVRSAQSIAGGKTRKAKAAG